MPFCARLLYGSGSSMTIKSLLPRHPWEGIEHSSNNNALSGSFDGCHSGAMMCVSIKVGKKEQKRTILRSWSCVGVKSFLLVLSTTLLRLYNCLSTPLESLSRVDKKEQIWKQSSWPSGDSLSLIIHLHAKQKIYTTPHLQNTKLTQGQH